MERSFKGHNGLNIMGEVYSNSEAHDCVLFAHGGGQTRYAWRESAKVIHEMGYTTCTVDLRGHGDSDWDSKGDYSMEAFAQDLILVSQEMPTKPIVVGASLGGIASMIAAGEIDPDCFKALVLVDITPTMDMNGVEKIISFMGAHLKDGFASLEEAAEVIAAYMPHRKAPKNLDGLKKNLRRDENGRYRWHWDPLFIEGTMRPSASRDPIRLVQGVKNISVPIALIRGRMSELVTEEAVLEFKKLVPTARYFDVSGAGHMVAGDSNDVFNDALVEYLQWLK